MSNFTLISVLFLAIGITSCGKKDDKGEHEEVFEEAFSLAASSEKDAAAESATSDANEEATKLITRFDLDGDNLLSNKEVTNLMKSVKSQFEEVLEDKKDERKDKKKIKL